MNRFVQEPTPSRRDRGSADETNLANRDGKAVSIKTVEPVQRSHLKCKAYWTSKWSELRGW